MKKRLLILMVALLATSCGNNNDTPDQKEFYSKDVPEYGISFDVAPYTVNDTKGVTDSGYFKMHGRHYYESTLQAEFINFSNSGFEVTFVGTTLEGHFFSTRASETESRPYLAVCIDNDYDPDKATPICLTSKTYSNCTGMHGSYYEHEHVVLAHGLEYGEHTVRVYKKSECLVSKVAIKAVSTDGELVPVKAKELPLKMEFYGDSVTCGYAVESTDYYEKFCTRTENSLMSYANYCANALNADVSLISCGGYPMYKSKYSQGCTPDNIPAMVSLADVEYATQTEHTWNNASYVPDVVVVALGANDGSILMDLKAESARTLFLKNYKTSYKNFIDKLFTLYPNTTVIVSDEILSIDDNFERIMDEIVNEYNSPKVIRAKYTAFERAVDRTMPGEGHPNKEMQRLAGLELAELITNALNK